MLWTIIDKPNINAIVANNGGGGTFTLIQFSINAHIDTRISRKNKTPNCVIIHEIIYIPTFNFQFVIWS